MIIDVVKDLFKSLKKEGLPTHLVTGNLWWPTTEPHLQPWRPG